MDTQLSYTETASAPGWEKGRNGAELYAWANARGIAIYQRSKTVWIAAGSYRGRNFEVKGRSPAIALALWVEGAQYTGQRFYLVH
ncbi:hypothetical protein EJ076_12535 [Mesorhizobium sp. M7D.F.Ca.US.005.01.1.1]|jgi:hypothetical protein|uniref:hypothetical protein n=1 Tax=Mesorhizobium sp. M7D.F.Ca.US.005.01.1.1 TaxID=2493678 RepID=UPI000F754FCF|nr:hypothetical protein [Mesorhizobium sp. M7D.F.Ca.US.005.01.1.1]AZO41848.1 hypothetical protein EJ076_12535 [Mesorhizobium sp. M7D.F.Ca.US.005.01.1.1]